MHNLPSVYTATRKGLRLVRSPLPLASVSAQGFAHDFAVVDLMVRLERAGHRVLTEREFRYAERRSRASYSVDLGLVRGRPAAHRPDLILTDDAGRHTAIELELSAKGADRLGEILRAYRRAQHLAGVTYIVPTLRDAVRIERAGDQLGLGERLRVMTIASLG